MQFDSVHGTWRGHSAVSTSDDAFEVDGKRVAFSEHKDFKDVDWKGLGVELVIECTGVFLTTEKLLPYVDKCGVKRVVVSAPVKEPSVLNVVVGVNDRITMTMPTMTPTTTRGDASTPARRR